MMFYRHGFRHWTHGRMFQKGDFKYLILDLLKDKPRYGYEIIKELEDRFHGFYSPSPGTIYPTLQYLEETGYVTLVEQDGKKIYTITEEGRKFLVEQKKTVDDIREQMKQGWGCWNPEMRVQFHDAMNDLRDLGRRVGQKARRINSDNMRRIRDVVAQAAKDIEKIISEDPESRS